MGYSYLGIEDDPLDGELLVAKGEARKGGAYIARITGTDPKYRYAREFLGNTRWDGHGKGAVKVAYVLTSELMDHEVLEIRAGGSWSNDYREFYEYVREPRGDGKRIWAIVEKRLREILAESKKQPEES